MACRHSPGGQTTMHSTRASGVGPRSRLAACPGSDRCHRALPSDNHASSLEKAPLEESKCPVLRLLPPKVQRPWWRELNFFLPPFQVQSEILAGGKPLALANFLAQQHVIVGDAALAREAMTRLGDVLEGSLPPHMLYVLGANSMAVAHGEAHAALRRLFAPAFTQEEVERYIPRIQAICERYCAKWAAAGRVERWQAEIKLLTFEIICTVVVGLEFSAAELSELSDQYGELVGAIAFPITWDVPFTPFGRGMAARRRIESRLRQQIQAYRSAPEGDKRAGGSILARLLQARDESGQPLSDAALVDNLIGTLIAGHDTTASSLAVALYYLANDPRVVQRMREEQAQVAAQHRVAVDGPISPAMLKDMEYLDAVLREAWRLHPVVPVVGRVALQEAQLGDYVIPKGQPVTVALNYILKTDPRWNARGAAAAAEAAAAGSSTAATAGTAASPPVAAGSDRDDDDDGRHAAADAGDDAMAFRPERFLTVEGRAQGQQWVFGAGKRACLGAALATAEAKLLLAVVVRGYSHRVAPGVTWTEFPFPTVQMDAEFGAVAGSG